MDNNFELSTHFILSINLEHNFQSACIEINKKNKKK